MHYGYPCAIDRLEVNRAFPIDWSLSVLSRVDDANQLKRREVSMLLDFLIKFK